jgi:tetratricopeptide (TPR) repeat protein
MRKVLFVLLLLFFFSGFSFPAVNGGIKGKVFDRSKNPIEGVQLTIISMEYPNEQHIVKTNKKGEFIHIGLSPGFYQVKCEKDDFTPMIKKVQVSLLEFTEVEFELNLVEKSEAQKTEPGDKDLRLANKFFQEGNYQQAFESYKDAIAKRPGDPTLYYNLGVTALHLERFEEAAEAFKKMLDLQPDSFSALKKLGEIYGKKKDFQTASQYFARAVAVSSNDPEAYYNLGISLLNTGDLKGAQEAFLKSIACQDSYSDSYYQLGLLYLKQNNRSEAQKAFEKFLQYAPNDAKAPTAKNMLELIKK